MRSERIAFLSLLALPFAAPAPAAVLAVTSAQDGGPGSLRVAITAAARGDRIDLVLPPDQNTIALDSALPPLGAGVVVELRGGARQVTIAGGALPLAPGGGMMLEIAPDRTLVLGTAVAGATEDRGLALAGGGTLVLTRPAAYRGGTSLADATLELGPGGELPPDGRVTMTESRLLVGAGGARIGRLAGSGDIVLGGPLSVDQEADTVFHGSITGIGQFTKAGAGRLSLTAGIGWSGGIVVTGGVLEVAGTGPGVQLRGSVTVKGGSLVMPGMSLGPPPGKAQAQ